MRWVNAIGGVWVLKMRCVNPDLRMSSYVDDRSLRARLIEDLQEGIFL